MLKHSYFHRKLKKMKLLKLPRGKKRISKNIFYIPLAKVIMFSALMAKVGYQGVVDLLDPKAGAIIDKWQRKAQETGRQYEIHSSIDEGKSLITITSSHSLLRCN